MATNFFWIGYHFEKFRSQVAIRKKKKINCTPWSLGHLMGRKPYFEIKILRLGLWDPTQSISYFSW